MGKKELPRISVVVITYNQSKLISRSLDSILLQAVWGLKDIIVCDDCSTDNNWEVILDYAERFPDYIRPYRNNQNKGIYANLQFGLSLLQDTDLVCICSGDDALCDGFFKNVINVVQRNQLDCQKEAFTVYCDWKQVSPGGGEDIFRNNLITKYSPISLKLRHLIGNRSIISSVEVYNRFTPVPVDRGVSVAENLFDIQIQQHSDKNFYCSFIGSIYYSGIGVSTTMVNKTDLQNLADSYRLLLEQLTLNTSDQRYLLFLIERYTYYIHPSVAGFFRTWFYYFMSIRYKLNIPFIIRSMGSMIFKLIRWR